MPTITFYGAVSLSAVVCLGAVIGAGVNTVIRIAVRMVMVILKWHLNG